MIEPMLTASQALMQCDELLVELAASADGGAVTSPDTAEHVGQCLRCQAELARYRNLRRRLRSMAADHVAPDDDLLETVLDQIRPAAPVHALRGHRRRLGRVHFALGGVAAAAAGVVGALVASRLSTRSIAWR